MDKKAVIILSGGIDSTGTGAYWRHKGYALYLISFFYGQRAKQELERARRIGDSLGAIEHKFVDISFMKELYGSTNVLTDETKPMPSNFQPNIIVPIRNAVFLTIASAWAFSIQAEIVAYGAHLTDNPYPDCRPEFAHRLAEAFNLGDIDAIRRGDHPSIRIWSPAIEGLKKAELLRKSFDLIGEIVYYTWSCYLNGDQHCGMCESCRNRKIAFNESGITDKTIYIQSQ